MPHPFPPFRGLLALACLLLPLAGAARADEPRRLAPRTDDTVVAGGVRLSPGAWSVPDANGDGVLQITQDDTVLDLTGAALIGAPEGAAADTYAGVGIRVVGAENVTIRGGVLRGFKIGIQAVDAPGLVIRNVDASENFRQHLGSTPAREDPADWLWPHTNDGGEWETRYGAGFSLTRCEGAHVSRCRVRQGQNGLLLTRCSRVQVLDNDFSFNSGWGVALYRSTRCIVARNACDFCVRGYSHGVYARGQDSAGLLVFEQSHDNVFVGNSATHSGDGFFLYAGHETTQRTGKGGCNRNLVFDNDFSFAVANGIEATFSLDNVFVRNDCSGCDHGIWAGYSARSSFVGNTLRDCLTAGISIEHGQENRILHNTIQGGRAGIHLWWDHDAAFVDGVFGQVRDTSSSMNVIHGNDIRNADVAVKLVGDTGTLLRWNDLRGRSALLELGAGTRVGEVKHNLLRGVRSPSAEPPRAVVGPAAQGFGIDPANQQYGHLAAGLATGLEDVPRALALVRPSVRLPDVPEPPGPGNVRRPGDSPRGRAQMRVDAWGPLDPQVPAAFPAAVAAAGPRALVDLVGRGSFEVLRVEGAVRVTPRRGALPGRLVIAAVTDPAVGALRRFEVEVDVGGRRRTVRGHLLSAQWQVVHFPWTTDPRADEASFLTLADAAGKAKPAALHDAVAFHWRSGGPEGLATDRFGTLATTTLKLPAGRYRLVTVSDDGVRAYVNGRRVIDNWTHHAATENVVELDLEAGVHALRIEHFEIDGWSHLEVRLELVR